MFTKTLPTKTLPLRLRKSALAAVLLMTLLTPFMLLRSQVSTADEGPTFLPPIHAPVVLDGVRYESGEFNRIHRDLYRQGVYLHFLIDPQDGTVYAFTKAEDFKAFQAKLAPAASSLRKIYIKTENGMYVFTSDEEAKGFLRQLEQQPTPGNSILNSPYYSSLFEHTNYAGYELRHPNNVKCPDLRNTDNCSVTKTGGGTNWNDRISSVQASSGSSVWTYLFEHINYQGTILAFQSGQVDPSLIDDGFNDRTSSTCVGSSSYCFP